MEFALRCARARCSGNPGVASFDLPFAGLILPSLSISNPNTDRIIAISSGKRPVSSRSLNLCRSAGLRAFVPHHGPRARIIRGREFATYKCKWPVWLRRQEKQCIIRGDKILFLDVLFLLAVQRIDANADQGVRGDSEELELLCTHTRLFCDSNKKTEGEVRF